MKRIIGKLLIVVGLLIISSVVYINYKTNKNNDDMVKEYETLMLNENETKDETTQNIPEGIIGILEIPKLNLKVVVEEGTDNETLKYAVGHFENTAMPGEKGNFAVAGHRAYTYNKFFSNLDEVKIGDYINMHTSKGSYRYKITNSNVVTPDKVDVLDFIDGEKIITLVTCTPKYIGSHRLILKGELCD